MSDTPEHYDEITTEPPDPRAGAEDSVAKVGERLQEEADALEDGAGEAGPGGPGRPEGDGKPPGG